MKKFLKGYTLVAGKVCSALCYVSQVFIAFMMIFMFVDSMGGLFFQKRILGSYEIVQCLLLVVVFSSWAYTQTKHGHIHVTMFVGFMPRVLKFICFGLTSLISVATMIFAARGAYRGILEKMASREATGTLLIPFWPLYIFMFLAFALMAVVLFCDALKAIGAIVDDELAEEVTSSWT